MATFTVPVLLAHYHMRMLAVSTPVLCATVMGLTEALFSFTSEVLAIYCGRKGDMFFVYIGLEDGHQK